MRASWRWRDAHAAVLDIAPYRVLRNRVLMDMAVTAGTVAARGLKVEDCMAAAELVVDRRVEAAVGFKVRRLSPTG